MEITWTKTKDDILKTEVASTKSRGDIGYVYQDLGLWVSVFIYENGDEGDTPCRSRKQAKQHVLDMLHSEDSILERETKQAYEIEKFSREYHFESEVGNG